VYDDSPDALVEAKDLYAELEAQGCRPWMDEKELDCGDVLTKEIFWTIQQCDFIIPIMTGGCATSLWCLRELYYVTLQKDSKKTIIPMLLEEEDIIDDQKAGKWLLKIGTQNYFKPTKEEKAAMVKSLKDKVFSILSIQWNLYIIDTLVQDTFIHYSEVSFIGSGLSLKSK
jgi:hypothetical protein